MSRILVIEDDPALNQLLAEALKTWGHDVVSALDGRRGYELIYTASPPFDLVLCDLELPKMPGPTLLRTAAQELRERTPVVIVTGADRLIDALGETRRWAFGILRKPFEMEHLREIVGHALEQRAVYARADHQAQKIDELESRVRDLVKQNQSLYEEARLDALTRLPNRRRLHEDLGRMYANADRYARPFALALLDVDGFRRYNSRLGYAGGDRAIQRVADLLLQAVRHGDTVYRFGGDEFVVVMQAQDLDQGIYVTDRLRAEVARTSPSESEERITLSGGVAAVQPGDPRSISALVRRADEQLRLAKAEGGNTVFPKTTQRVAKGEVKTA